MNLKVGMDYKLYSFILGELMVGRPKSAAAISLSNLVGFHGRDSG
jgi:hypothetical protein